MKIHFLLPAILVLFGACNEGKAKKNAAADPLAGNWLTKSYVDSLSLTQSPMALSEGCDEVIFPSGFDTMLYIGVGSDVNVFSFERLNDSTARVFNFSDPYKDFHLSSDGNTLFFVDSFSQKKFVFQKLNPEFATGESGNPKLKSANERWFNQTLLAGTYVHSDAQGDSTRSVVFYPDGTLEGWEGFDKYFICASGICTSLSSEDYLTLQKADQPGVDFGWQMKANTLEIYQLKDVSAGEGIPHYEREKLLMKLTKIN